MTNHQHTSLLIAERKPCNLKFDPFDYFKICEEQILTKSLYKSTRPYISQRTYCTIEDQDPHPPLSHWVINTSPIYFILFVHLSFFFPLQLLLSWVPSFQLPPPSMAPLRPTSNLENISPEVVLTKRCKLVVNVMFEDPDMTDSSSDDESPFPPNQKKKKMYVHRIEHEWSPPLPPPSTVISQSPPPPPPAISPSPSLSLLQPPIPSSRMRLRKRGRYGTEIWVPDLRKKVWLGTFSTRKEGASAYNIAALRRTKKTQKFSMKKERENLKSSSTNASMSKNQITLDRV